MHIGFTGTRHGMTPPQYARVKLLLEQHQPEAVHHGDCKGADAQVHDIARQLGIAVIIHPPDDDKARAFCEGGEVLEPKPYLERNKDIVLDTDMMIAAPLSAIERLRSGTWACVRFAKKMGRRVRIISS